MAKKKSYNDMTLDELALVRIQLDKQIQDARAEKLKIQKEIDDRAKKTPGRKADHTIGGA